MDSQAIREALFARQDLRYRDFQIKLIPTVRPETVIGVRTPDLRRLAGEMRKEGGAKDFLAELPHAWFEENQLHAFLLSARRDFKACLEGGSAFSPSWTTGPPAIRCRHGCSEGTGMRSSPR